jgi:hypothetical protein
VIVGNAKYAGAFPILKFTTNNSAAGEVMKKVANRRHNHLAFFLRRSFLQPGPIKKWLRKAMLVVKPARLRKH